MSNVIPHDMRQISRSAISPAAPFFHYGHALALRNMVLASGDAELPLYLLAPEIAVLLAYFPDLRQRLYIDTLWNTGARLNEALALTPGCFYLDAVQPFVVLKTLKQRTIGKGRPKNGQALKRIVPLLDAEYVARLREYVATFKPKKHEPLWVNKKGEPVSDETPRGWLRAAVDRAARDGVTFSLPVITPKTFRHSFAMHLVQHGVAFKIVQTYMGHKDAASTEVYTKVFALDVGAEYGVRFSMATSDARALIAGTGTLPA
ncbi:TPA: tyrosine-type recombinase/integrase [Yersinia enterocolitica]|nr:tyrosine-type recombinase/integrase [Yersinia enterocolitica]